MSVTEPPVHHRLTYQPALDGLRAVAVGLVLLYHQQGPRTQGLFRGGYIGVDIFFVLSGYLITRLLVDEYSRSGRIRVGQFWRRRFRRLMPALVAMLALVAVLDRMVYSPELQAAVQRDVPWVVTYFENWHILYWHGSSTTPLSHTWSLAVEEQWYLLWPAALWAATRVARGRLRVLASWAFGLAIASAVLTFLMRDGVGLRIYFGTDVRAQELLVGAALGLWMASSVKQPERPVSLWCNVGGLVAFAAVVGVAVVVSNSPSWALGGYLGFAVLVAVVLHVATRSGSALGSMLAVAPLVALGRISYGVYLFHLPIFMWLDPNATGLTGWSLFAVRFVSTLSVALASYFLIEQPIRRSRHVGAPVLVGGAVVLVGVFLATSIGLAEPIGSPRSKILAYALLTQRSATPAGAERVLVVGGSATALLGAQRTGTLVQPGVQGASVGVLGCGLASRVPRCLDVSGDVPALRVAFQPRWLVLVPDRVDIAAFGDRSTAAITERRLGETLQGARSSSVVVLLDQCVEAALPAGTQRLRSWAARSHVRVVERASGGACAPTAGVPLSWPQIIGALGRR